MGTAVRWDRLAGDLRRKGHGQRIYRAVRSVLKNDGMPGQEVKTFNAARVPNALKKAQLWRQKGAMALAGGETQSEAGRLTLREAFEAFLADPNAELASKTQKTYRGYFAALERSDATLPSRRLKEISKSHFRAVLQRIEGRVMRDEARTVVHGIYAFHEVVPDPAVKPRQRRTRANKLRAATLPGQYIDDGAMHRLLTAMPDRYRGYVWLMWRAGLRPQEAAALRVGDLNLETNELTIERVVWDGEMVQGSKTGKDAGPSSPRRSQRASSSTCAGTPT